MIFKSLVASAILLLAGCATPGYQEYLNTQKEIAKENGNAARVKAVAIQKIADDSDDPTVKAVSAMMIGFATQTPVTPVAAPRSEALEWFKASVPILGTIVDRRYALRMQENNNETQVQLYSTQMDAFSNVTLRGYNALENVSLSGMDYASKPPLVIHGAAPAPEPAEE